MQYGRKEIFTSEKEVTAKNIIQILRDALPIHEENANRIDFLLRYEEGNQPILREKKYRSDINCIVNDNIAAEITDFKLGFMWSNPITFVQRGLNDDGLPIENKGINQINECYDTEYIKSKVQKLGRFVEIGGVGYSYTDLNTDYQDGDSFWKYEILDPRFTFVIRSSYYIDHRIMVGVTYRVDKYTNTRHYTCFTKDLRFEIIEASKIENGKEVNTWNHKSRSGEENPLHAIPIVEWIRNYDRLGAWERSISEMNNLNLLISDYTNDIEQNTMVIWHTNDVDFPKDKNGETKKPKTNDMLQTYTSPDGKTPFVKPLTVGYDYSGMLANIVNRRATILQKCHVPSRGNTSGGSTTGAMDSAIGWNDAENIANLQQSICEGSRMEELKLALICISKSDKASEEISAIKLRDVQPCTTRTKNYDIATKINAFATGVSHGINGKHMLQAINLFTDVASTWQDSKDLIEKYQSGLFDKETKDEGRLMADLSDQEDNSPLIGSLSTKDAEVVD